MRIPTKVPEGPDENQVETLHMSATASDDGKREVTAQCDAEIFAAAIHVSIAPEGLPCPTRKAINLYDNSAGCERKPGKESGSCSGNGI